MKLLSYCSMGVPSFGIGKKNGVFDAPAVALISPESLVMFCDIIPVIIMFL